MLFFEHLKIDQNILLIAFYLIPAYNFSNNLNRGINIFNSFSVAINFDQCSAMQLWIYFGTLNLLQCRNPLLYLYKKSLWNILKSKKDARRIIPQIHEENNK